MKPKTINIYRKATPNVGDITSSPTLYFKELIGVASLDVRGYLALDGVSSDEAREWMGQLYLADYLIIGGGGLLGLDFFKPSIDTILEQKRTSTKTVLWGAGHNNTCLGGWENLRPKIDPVLQKMDLIGLRDYDIGYEWVPCPSCMHPLFNTIKEPLHDVIFFKHYDVFNPGVNADYTSFKGIQVNTNCTSTQEAIEFLSTGDLILTDSFHGAYWATLLGRRVVAFPTSEKFYGLKHPIPLCNPADWQRYAKLGTRYPEALEECRSANLIFSEKVFDLIGV